MNRKVKIFLKTMLLLISIIISICLIIADLIILLKYSDHYTISSNIEQNYVKKQLENEINIDLSENSEITKIEFDRIFDASKYKITYNENGEEKVVERTIDSDRINLDQYMKQYGKTNNFAVYSVILLIVIFQIGFPIFCLILLIKEIKRYKNEG